MHQALERQLGARGVDLDTLGGWVNFYVSDPMQFDFRKLDEAFESASYEMFTVDIAIYGNAVEESGALWMVVDETNQRLPLASRPAAGAEGKVRFNVAGWDTDSPRLEPTPVSEG